MPDITKCSGVGCKLKQECYRYTSKADDYQAYFLTPPIKGNQCKHIIKIKSNEPKKRR